MPGPEDATLPPAPLAAPLTHADANATDGDAAPGGAAPPPASPGRYHIGEEIARGGMGVVYRATDAAFGREVAVKVLHEKFAPGSAASRRFDDEARITAQLQHPNIPAVFDQGALPDGRPFLAMKLIKGQTLDHQLAARPDPGHDRGRLVAVFEQVCQAVAYAHAHGVIHRDLKPGNVMVGTFGEVQVMDWGLAKVLASRDREGAEADPQATTAETQVQSLRGGEFTQAGQALGTPAFMPPEQAVGALGKVDARSDVFGLGAILAVILTGRPPFTGGSAETVRVRAAQGDVAECLARLQGCGAEPGLVELCRRCLSLRPGDRPADADEVAKAVAKLRSEADERARRAELDRVEAESRAQERRKRRRVWRWAAAVLAASLVGGLGAVLSVQRRANAELTAKNQELDSANADLQAERERAEQRFELAQKAIKAFHTGVSEDALLKNEELKPLRTKFLVSAADFYRQLERLLKEEKDDGSRRKLGTAYFDLAYLTNLIGDKKHAEAAHRRSLAIRHQLAEEHRDIIHYQRDLAQSHYNLGLLLREWGRQAEAEAEFRQALAARRKLADQHPTVPQYLIDLARSQLSLGVLLREAGQLSKAEAAYRQAMAVQQKVAGANPTVPQYQSELAASHNNLAVLLQAEGRKAEAEQAYHDALAINQRLANAQPSTLQYQRDLARNHYNLGLILHERGQRSRAEEAYRLALAVLQKLADGQPSVHEYRSQMADAENSLGVLLFELGRKAESETAYRSVLATRQKLADAHPSFPRYQSGLAESQMSLGVQLYRTGRRAEAEKLYRSALATRQRLAGAHPAHFKYQSDMAGSHNNLGALLHEVGRIAEAEKAYREALAIYRKLAIAQPTVLLYRIDLAGEYANLGNLKRDEGSFVEAFALYRASIELLEAARKTMPAHETARRNLRASHWGRARALDQLNRHREAAADWRTALALETEGDRPALIAGLALAVARAGDIAEAIRFAGQLTSGSIVANEAIYDAARVHAVCGSVAAAEAARPLPDREKLAEDHVRAAVSLLRRAHREGYFRDAGVVARLQKCDEFAILRTRDDFQALLGELGVAPPERLPMPRKE